MAKVGADEPFVFARRGRSARIFMVLIVIYAALAGAVILVDASPWLMAALALPTLPALWDLYFDPGAGVRLDAERLTWHSRRRRVDLGLDEIDHMRFDTRWDFSVRVSAVLHDGKRLRLPHEALPPHRLFETAFVNLGVTVTRHHFSIF